MRWGGFVTADCATLRWAFLGSESAPAHCVLVGGFSECIEKYFETITDLVARGLSVWCLEWRGQGESTRPRRHPARPEARDFERDATDLADFSAGAARGGKPLVIVGHSMGAATALLAMRRRPELFAAAALSVPMLALNTGRISPLVARAISATAVGLGFGRAVVPGTRTWPVDADTGPERSRTSSDAIRCRVQALWFAARPPLRIDGITYAWLRSALDLCRRFEHPRSLSEIAVPVLIGSAGMDWFVDADAHRRAATTLPNCRHVVFVDAKHELFMEADRIRDRWLAEIDRLLRDADIL
jgi:lysophospholipase